MFGMTPKGTKKCPVCRGAKTESYYADERVGGGTRETRRVEKKRACSGCGGNGFVAA